MDDRLHLGLTSKFFTPSTCKSFVVYYYRSKQPSFGYLFFSRQVIQGSPFRQSISVVHTWQSMDWGSEKCTIQLNNGFIVLKIIINGQIQHSSVGKKCSCFFLHLMFLFQIHFAKSVISYSLPIPVDAEFQLLAASSNWLNPQKKM